MAHRAFVEVLIKVSCKEYACESCDLSQGHDQLSQRIFL